MQGRGFPKQDSSKEYFVVRGGENSNNWELVRQELAAAGKFEEHQDKHGNPLPPDYTVIPGQDEFGPKMTIFTDDPAVKDILSTLPMVKPKGQVETIVVEPEGQEVIVAPMPIEDVRAAFDWYDENRERGEDPIIREGVNYELDAQEDGTTHITPLTGNEELARDFDRVLSSGKLPIGDYTVKHVSPEQGKDAGGKDAGRGKAKY